MKQALVVLNKKSGQFKNHRTEEKLIHKLKETQYEAMIKPTPEAGAEGIISKHAEDKDLIVVVGGDGTISEVIDALMKRELKIPVAIIPTGTVNDLARVHNIPLSPEKAIGQFGHWVETPIDIIKLNDRHASYLVALGAFMTAFAEVDAGIKNKLGRLAYLFAGTRMLLRLKRYNVTIKTGEREVRGASVLTIISKLRSVGSLGRLIRKAGPDDGLLHIINICPVNVFEALHLVWLAVRGNITDHPKVTYMAAASAEIEAAGLKLMNIDGDVHEYEDLDISVMRGAVSLMKPLE
ncbi:diacylglycerol/lipid kinase family protein [Lacicoccus alkaliphilus]|uniref:Diacylglycerol kinase (ATP) n=1 Tax=Lacicoccus alkaliphilus DSM 16010 TaxID=1123231 RepID=A0A1M7J4L1_9BACL|nr:YegS/Rv2252/BmrU family lipid kinase [Salinicoccus alkaliphilus]SHM47955.1 diacylglycerol kinase (ATP) [Salinicoccus alkaliphilus DSM 16010]